MPVWTPAWTHDCGSDYSHVTSNQNFNHFSISKFQHCCIFIKINSNVSNKYVRKKAGCGGCGVWGQMGRRLPRERISSATWGRRVGFFRLSLGGAAVLVVKGFPKIQGRNAAALLDWTGCTICCRWVVQGSCCQMTSLAW